MPKKPHHALARRTDQQVTPEDRPSGLTPIRPRDELAVHLPAEQINSRIHDAPTPEPASQCPQIVYIRASYSYQKISHRSTSYSHSTHSRGGDGPSYAPAALPASQSGAAHVLIRGVQLCVWLGLLGVGVFFVGRSQGWW